MVCLRLFLVVVGLTTGCTHLVRIESSPGAEIVVDGKAVGKAPVTFEETAGSAPVKITARLPPASVAPGARVPGPGRERTIVVERTEVSLTSVAAGGAIGAGACAAVGVVALVLTTCSFGLLFYPALALQVVGCLLPVAGAGGAWWVGGKHLPEVVVVDINGAPPPVTPPPLAPLPPPRPLFPPSSSSSAASASSATSSSSSLSPDPAGQRF